MALSGTITGTTENKYIDSKIVWSATQSVDGNYSMVTATLHYSRNNTGYSTNGTWNGSITINGVTKTGTNSLSITYQSDTVAITNTVKVIHDNNGAKTITISASGSMPSTSLKSTTISGSVQLTTIPRAATLNSLTCSTSYLDGTLTYKYTPTTTSYYIRSNLSLNLNGTYIDINSYNNGAPSSTAQQSKTIQLSTSQLETIYNKIPNSTVATLKMTLSTYSDASYSTQVGNSSDAEVKLTIPMSVKPKVGEISLIPAVITIGEEQFGYLIKGKNRLSLSVSGSTAGTGSSIKSYTFSGPSLYETTTNSSTSITTVTDVDSFVNGIATITYTVTATDTRNRVSDPKTQTIICHDYQAPYFKSFDIRRSGATLTCDYVPVFQSLNEKNIAEVQIYYTSGSTTSTKTISGILSDNSTSTQITLSNDASTYQVYAVILDGLGEKSKTSTKTSYGNSRVMNAMRDGSGIAFGKKAEERELLESRWPIKANGYYIPAIQHGSVSIKPTANTPTSINVVFEQPFSGVPTVVATPQTNSPGISVLGIGVYDINSDGFKVWLTKADNTNTVVNWIATC